jgi:hypothetical protein
VSQSRNWFVPELESLDERLNTSSAIPPQVTELSVVVSSSRPVSEAPTTLEGHECLVFFLGGIPSR